MSNIALSDGFTLIPEGTHVFQITNVNYKEVFGKMEITMKTASGQTHTERFSLLNADKTPNQGALNAFSYFAKTAMNDFTLTSIEHTALVGKFIQCGVEHTVQPNKNKPGQTVTFIKLTDKQPADGFETSASVSVPAPTEKPVEAVKKPSGGFDLNKLLGK